MKNTAHVVLEFHCSDARQLMAPNTAPGPL